MIKRCVLFFCCIPSNVALSINEELICKIKENHAATELAAWKKYKKEWRTRLSVIDGSREIKYYEEKIKLKEMSDEYYKNRCSMNQRLKFSLAALREEKVLHSKL